MAAAAIKATFSNIKPVPSRKVVQLIFEIPSEQADEALAALGGMPQPAASRWCAIARLTPDKPVPERKPYAERSEGEQAVSRAAMLCDDAAFLAWLGATDDEQAAQMVRDYCGVTSRREIANNPAALAAFKRLEADFRRRVPMKASA